MQVWRRNYPFYLIRPLLSPHPSIFLYPILGKFPLRLYHLFHWLFRWFLLVLWTPPCFFVLFFFNDILDSWLNNKYEVWQCINKASLLHCIIAWPLFSFKRIRSTISSLPIPDFSNSVRSKGNFKLCLAVSTLTNLLQVCSLPTVHGLSRLQMYESRVEKFKFWNCTGPDLENGSSKARSSDHRSHQ